MFKHIFNKPGPDGVINEAARLEASDKYREFLNGLVNEIKKMDKASAAAVVAGSGGGSGGSPLSNAPQGVVATPYAPNGVILTPGGWLTPGTEDPFNSEHLLSMLAMRMRWHRQHHTRHAEYGHPFKSLGVASNHDDSLALVFVVTHTGHVLLEDDMNMYPSDNLITKLRLLTP